MQSAAVLQVESASELSRRRASSCPTIQYAFNPFGLSQTFLPYGNPHGVEITVFRGRTPSTHLPARRQFTGHPPACFRSTNRRTRHRDEQLLFKPDAGYTARSTSASPQSSASLKTWRAIRNIPSTPVACVTIRPASGTAERPNIRNCQPSCLASIRLMPRKRSHRTSLLPAHQETRSRRLSDQRWPEKAVKDSLPSRSTRRLLPQSLRITKPRLRTTAGVLRNPCIRESYQK